MQSRPITEPGLITELQPISVRSPTIANFLKPVGMSPSGVFTGSTGLDDAEWGVRLFARETFQIKAIVYKMRFDPVSAEYADFGEFYIGIQLPLDELFRRLQLQFLPLPGLLI